jgi:hypothetical protein
MKADLALVAKNFTHILEQKNKLTYHQLRCLRALQACRTETMGGRVEQCSCCGKRKVFYNSCRNRNCPKCGGLEREKWLMAREADLLPVSYLHMVFTIPDKLNKLFLKHQKDCYNILFRTVKRVMDCFADNPDFLGARIGYTAVLHTWGQNLQYHPHLHLVVPAGGITANDKWLPSKGDGEFLFPVKEMSKVFRAKMVAALRQWAKEEEIPTSNRMFNSLFEKPWAVYAKPPFAGPKQVLAYLGRYTHRTAISDGRILQVDNKTVTFRWRDYRDGDKQKISMLPGEVFLQRFCLHILPHGFTRIRHYGFMSSAAKGKALPALYEYFNQPRPQKKKMGWEEIAETRMDIVVGFCTHCGARMRLVEIIPESFHQRIRAPDAS